MKNFLCLFIIYNLFLCCSSTRNESLLVGTYTNDVSQGINFIDFNSKTNTLKLNAVISGIENPSFVISNKAKNIVVTVEEIQSNLGGKVTSFFFNKSSKTFIKINSMFTYGNHPCTLTFSPKEDFIIVGNYSGGNLSVFPIDNKGKFSEKIEFIQYYGSSINTERQEKPHVHCISVHPKENKIFIADLGSDNIKMIPFDENSKSFLQKEKEIDFKINPGAGPRHMVWNEKGTKLFVTFELTNEVAIFNYKNNHLEFVQTILLTTATINGSTAELRLSNDERFIYASTRGNDNQISVIDVSLPKAIVIQTIKTKVKPRNFILTKNQDKVLVASQDDNLVSVFNRDIETGLLTATSNEISIHKPVYLFPF